MTRYVFIVFSYALSITWALFSFEIATLILNIFYLLALHIIVKCFLSP